MARRAPDWNGIRHGFHVDPGTIDLAAMLMASPHETVARAIQGYRRRLDRQPHSYAAEHNSALQERVFAAVARYFGVPAAQIADTHSTTCALAQVHGGLHIPDGCEVLTSLNEHFTTLDTLMIRARRDRVPFRQVPLFRDSRTATQDEIVRNVGAAIRPWTRILALAWVYSSDGVKLPIRRIADLVADENSRRIGDPPLILVVDGVHGFGVENETFTSLGCDFFVSGCHKWIFGPRGTAIICGRDTAWPQLGPWIASQGDTSFGPGRAFIPGGVRAYEHWWAVADAVQFLLSIGKSAIQDRMRVLTAQVKQGLASIDGVTVRTPMSPDLSAGVVCFDVDGMSSADVVDVLLRRHHVRGTESAWDAASGGTHARFSPSILNTESDVSRALAAVEKVARGRHRSKPKR